MTTMSTPSSLVGRDTFDPLNIEYEKAYINNKFKKACIVAAISMLPTASRVLDVGCGTGVPVSQLLAEAGHDVVGFDISPNMIKVARNQVKGSFTVSDMLEFEIRSKFDAVFIIFSHLQLSYADVHHTIYKYAIALKPNGILAIGQMPSDTYVKNISEYDETKTYVENYNVPFMGKPLPTFMMSAEGQREFLRSMGMEIIWEITGEFQPNNEKCDPEEQQYIIAKAPEAKDMSMPKPLPKLSK